MTRLSVWLEQLFFEDNNLLQRRTSRVLSLIRKLLFAIPHAFLLVFANFASAMPRTQNAAPPEARDPRMTTLTLTDWPQSPSTGFERGLPFSDSSISRLEVGTALARVSDLSFVVGEIHRVCTPDTRVLLQLSDPDDPFQKRVLTRVSIDRLSGDRFAVTASGVSDIELRVLKVATNAPHARKIDIGCGSKLRPGYTGIDRMALPAVSVVRDVERHGLPFSDSTIEAVSTAHFLEHVTDLVFVMNEIHRVCCHNAIVEISVPTLLGPFAAADPTHVRFFNARTFKYFEPGGDDCPGIVQGFQILRQSVSFSLEVTLRVLKAT